MYLRPKCEWAATATSDVSMGKENVNIVFFWKRLYLLFRFLSEDVNDI